MNRSRCKNTYFQNKTVENWERYRKLRNECVKLTKKVKREYYQNLNISSINDNKTFWKTVKPLFSDKNKNRSKIILVEDENIITDDKKNAEIMNEYFVNITKDLNISGIMTETLPENIDVRCIDPIEKIIHNYRNHPSICKINEIVKPTEKFSFHIVNESQIENEICKLNSKKSAGYDDIPPRVIKDSVRVLKAPLTNLFNTSVEISHFPDDLKYANVSPLFKNDESTSKKNYRPISILPSVSKIFERMMFQQVTYFVSNFLSPYLCGFRKGYNAQHALLRLKNI